MYLTTNVREAERPTAADLLDAMRAAVSGAHALDGLDPQTYARDHAMFEARSNQRGLITDWLLDRLAARATGPLSVLSVGCGDGSVDVALAAAATTPRADRPVRYVGVEPFAGSAKAFASKLTALDRSGLDVDTRVTTFDDADLDEQFDVVTFVHSMYYVPDVVAALHRAYDLLRPGGELLVLSAPRGVLNQLASALAPQIDGHRQWFSDDVAAAFLLSELDLAHRVTLDARVDLTDATPEILDFTVQARISPLVMPLVESYLADVADPGPRLLVPHPVDAYVVRRPDSA